MKRRLIPVLAIAAAFAPTTAQAQVMLDGGSSVPSTSVSLRPDDRATRGVVFDQIQQPVSGLDQTRVIPGYNAPALVSAPSAGGLSWGGAGYGILAGSLAAFALAAAAIGLRRQKRHTGLAY